MPTVNPDDPTIASLCEDAVLPAGIGVDDCFDPTLLYGPGTNLYMSLTPFPNPVSPSTEAVTAPTIAAKQLAAAPDQLSKPIICQLSLSPATPANDRINGRNYPKPGDLSLGITIQDLSESNYNLMRQTQKGGLLAHFWFVDRNGYFYGGQNGIFGGQALLALRLNLPSDETALQTITGTITASGFFDPKRQISPVAYK